MILKDTATFQVPFIVSLFYAWNITTVEINSGVHLRKSSSSAFVYFLWSFVILILRIVMFTSSRPPPPPPPSSPPLLPSPSSPHHHQEVNMSDLQSRMLPRVKTFSTQRNSPHYKHTYTSFCDTFSCSFYEVFPAHLSFSFSFKNLIRKTLNSEMHLLINMSVRYGMVY